MPIVPIVPVAGETVVVVVVVVAVVARSGPKSEPKSDPSSCSTGKAWGVPTKLNIHGSNLKFRRISFIRFHDDSLGNSAISRSQIWR